MELKQLSVDISASLQNLLSVVVELELVVVVSGHFDHESEHHLWLGFVVCVSLAPLVSAGLMLVVVDHHWLLELMESGQECLSGLQQASSSFFLHHTPC